MLHRTIVMPAGRHTASLIFLHGSGDTGIGVRSWIDECFDRVNDKRGFNFNHIKVIYPTAPPQPYTASNGNVSNVWFDRKKISFKAPEVKESINSMITKLADIIKAEEDSGISLDRIIIGGFSMGGAMALHLGYRSHPKLRGIFALSSFLNEESPVYGAITARKDDKTTPELFMAHGDRDELVKFEWGEKTFQKLQTFGVKGEFKRFKYLHELGTEEMIYLRQWIDNLLPDTSPNKL